MLHVSWPCVLLVKKLLGLKPRGLFGLGRLSACVDTVVVALFQQCQGR